MVSGEKRKESIFLERSNIETILSPQHCMENALQTRCFYSVQASAQIDRHLDNVNAAAQEIFVLLVCLCAFFFYPVDGFLYKSVFMSFLFCRLVA